MVGGKRLSPAPKADSWPRGLAKSPSQPRHHRRARSFQGAVPDGNQTPAAGSDRKLDQYQEDQREHISETLTVIEQKWARQQRR